MACNACPFSFSDASEYALNLGCLPSFYDIMKSKRETGRNWACHSDETRICAGFAQECREQNIPYKGAPLVTLSDWNLFGFDPLSPTDQSAGGGR